jgi:hypothetical protein
MSIPASIVAVIASVDMADVVGVLMGLSISVALGCAVGSTVASVVATVVALGAGVGLGAAVTDPQATRTLSVKTLNPILKISRRNTLSSIILTSSLSGSFKHQPQAHAWRLPPSRQVRHTSTGGIYHAKLNGR